MAKVLFVKANDRPAEQAVSVKMYETFLNAYKSANPSDEVTELDLFAAELPYYGNKAITALYKQAQSFPLAEDEKKLADLIESYMRQFLAADKVVFAFPLWNYTVPAPLVTYISYLAQAGRTFKYTAEGPIGLAGDKKVVLLSARGGDYSNEFMAAMEAANRFVTASIGLWGIQPEIVVIEGHNQYKDRSEEILENGLNKVAAVAAGF